jgi:hypothetical protein
MIKLVIIYVCIGIDKNIETTSGNDLIECIDSIYGSCSTIL